jgi:hypothetical protein
MVKYVLENKLHNGYKFMYEDGRSKTINPVDYLSGGSSKNNRSRSRSRKNNILKK